MSLLRGFLENAASHMCQSRGEPPNAEKNASLCPTCSKLDLQRILRHGVPKAKPIPIGSLLDVIAKAERCAFCGLIRTSFQRVWLLDKLPADIDLSLIDLELYAEEKGCLQKIHPPAKELCHRLIISPTHRPKRVFDFIAPARSIFVLHIQLMQEDAHIFNRRPDIHGRRVGDVADIALIKTWLNLCQRHHHDVCEEVWWRDKDGPLPPTVRMIDVERMMIVPTPAGCRYIALSYVWGGVSGDYQTTQDNISRRMSPGGLSESIFPATIADAIELCRRLGERYLWVDALCIIQDSTEDKAIQIGVMEQIYGGSFVTVFAVGGHNAHAGLPGLREGTRACHQHVEKIQGLHLTVPLTSLISLLTQSIWGKRGWTYQEGILSRRRLFFTDQQVYFECLREVFSEDVVAESQNFSGSQQPLRYNGIGGFTFHTRPDANAASNPNIFGPAYGTIIREYSQRILTNELDAIDAVSALTNSMVKAYNLGGGVVSKAFRYGMLLTDLNQTLLWHPGDGPSFTRRRSVPGLSGTWPSWSWVGWRGAVQYRHKWSSGHTYPLVTGSLIDAWYMYDHDGALEKLDVRAISRIVRPEVEEKVTRYSPPSGQGRIDTTIRGLPGGTLVFLTTSATFRIVKLLNAVDNNMNSGQYELYSILPVHGPNLDSAVGQVYLPSNLPTSELEFIVLAHVNGQDGLHDEVHGKSYSSSFLVVMAVRFPDEIEYSGTPRLRERVGVGIIFEPIWIGAHPQGTVVYLA
ncbi:hypothetical protein EYR40_001425 [Pleurotus pulmonarius]|nr:hypothetical protein EYR38_004666 [Pleurotus pulmonarius]KAF4609072.1 hypothetical protein EYR40_001425 [Pleurotus pulmonarius]